MTKQNEAGAASEIKLNPEAVDDVAKELWQQEQKLNPAEWPDHTTVEYMERAQAVIRAFLAAEGAVEEEKTVAGEPLRVKRLKTRWRPVEPTP
jgi:hypothetical protein